MMNRTSVPLFLIDGIPNLKLDYSCSWFSSVLPYREKYFKTGCYGFIIINHIGILAVIICIVYEATLK
jgi:hypothetical protein